MDEMDDMPKELKNVETPAVGKRKRNIAFLKSHPVSSMTLGAGVVGALAIATVSPALGGITIGAALFSALASAVAENTLLNDHHKDDLRRG